jgi:amidophosphoribosyltransferase
MYNIKYLFIVQSIMINHNCGIFGIVDSNASILSVDIIKKLDHRGHDSAGIVICPTIDSTNKKIFVEHKMIGSSSDVFNGYTIDEPANIAIGHTRYSTITNKANIMANTQPFVFEKFAMVHNGNIPLINKYCHEFDIEYDSELSDSYLLGVIISGLYHIDNNWAKVLNYIVDNILGAYSLIILSDGIMYALRDKYGIRPLTYGVTDSGYIIVSETHAVPKDIDIIYTDMDPGEILSFSEHKSIDIIRKGDIRGSIFCSFEYIYFMRHDSILSNSSVNDVRYEFGQEMAMADTEKADVVLYVPSTPLPSAYAYADTLKIPIEDWIKKSGIVDRTFILPTQEARREAVQKKFIYDNQIKGKDIYLIDDSIVRGTTMKEIIRNLRKVGVNKIHLRSMSPPIIGTCYYGIDMASKEDLVANGKTIEEIRTELNVDTLRYMDINVLRKVLGDNICVSCFTGKYDSELLSW